MKMKMIAKRIHDCLKVFQDVTKTRLDYTRNEDVTFKKYAHLNITVNLNRIKICYGADLSLFDTIDWLNKAEALQYLIWLEKGNEGYYCEYAAAVFCRR